MGDANAPLHYSAEVRGQYEDYPYPHRDPETEGSTYLACDPYSLTALSHAGWGGKRDMRQKLRVLSAGCGTGDAIIEFAEELYECDAELVAIDLSSKSIEIAKARLAKRGLTNVTFHHLSILDAPSAGLGQFDIIESSGVLHHLPDPDAGLAALAQLLKDDGMMAIMVYAQYGRFPIYLVQELMKRLLNDGMSRAEKIERTREFLNNVPAGHWITVKNEMFLADMRIPDGSGLYDLFLHSTDRAYTVPQLYDWVKGAGLQLNALFNDMSDESLYSPESYNDAPALRALFAEKSPRERHAIAELMNGNISKHFFYASKQPKQVAEFADDMVITYGPMQHLFAAQFVPAFAQALRAQPVGQRVNGKPRPFEMSPPLYLTCTPHAAALLEAIDGTRSIGELVALVATRSAAAYAEVRHQLEVLYNELRTRQLVFLRHQSIAPYRTGEDIIARVKAFQGR